MSALFLMSEIPLYSTLNIANFGSQGDRDALDFWALFAAAVEARALELNAQVYSVIYDSG